MNKQTFKLEIGDTVSIKRTAFDEFTKSGVGHAVNIAMEPFLGNETTVTGIIADQPDLPVSLGICEEKYNSHYGVDGWIWPINAIDRSKPIIRRGVKYWVQRKELTI